MGKEPILHRDLAAELQMSVSNLSNVMKRMRNMATPLVEENVVGRNKFYQLNRDGRRYILESLGTGDEEENLIYTPPKNYENLEKLCCEINGEYIKFAELFSMAEPKNSRKKFIYPIKLVTARRKVLIYIENRKVYQNDRRTIRYIDR